MLDESKEVMQHFETGARILRVRHLISSSLYTQLTIELKKKVKIIIMSIKVFPHTHLVVVAVSEDLF